MLEEILPNLFKITVPLPEHPLRTVNSYLIMSAERNLVIDTGWNRLESAEALLNAFDEIGITLARTDLFLTHIHADHAGLIGLFKAKGTKIFCGRGDLEMMDNYINISKDKSWKLLSELAKPHGFPMGEIEAAIAVHPGNQYGASSSNNFVAVDDQDIISVGDYKFYCISTPGHTPGHMCLYEPSRKFLFSGDHLLGGFSPTISQWNLADNYVANYLASLDRLAEYAVDTVLPGHWDLFKNYHVRIKETKAYHQCRQSEIIGLFVDGKPLTAYQVASSLSYNKNNREWLFLPVTRKWALIADAIAQLCYLRDQGALQMTINHSHVTWNR
ncbi:MBL fold metallo-hydrolase [Pelosinus sp. sgz500959]|uniref:MBL fold metallo-hydrolase n=1 Tax=Pelosinus sp. sgz500959 TaxID=3242472 RepID=UPI0036725F41